MPTRKPSKRKAATPATMKEALSKNVRTQRRRAKFAESPPEAKRPPRERARTAQKRINKK